MKVPDISKEIFGGILVYDGAGLYPGLELLNLVYGVTGGQVLPEAEKVTYTKSAHDFSRRLVWDYDKFSAEDDIGRIFVGEHGEHAIKELLSCLQMPIPNSTKIPSWERAHFFPYTKSLIHWDARLRGKKISVERRYLRGAGAFTHKILRSDPDTDRLAEIRDGFSKLFPDSVETPLEKLSEVLLTHGKRLYDLTDEEESSCNVLNDSLEHMYREGIRNILSHNELSSTARIKAIINWTGFWLISAQAQRAQKYLGVEVLPIVVDCGSSPSQIRRESSRRMKDMQSFINQAAEKCVRDGDGVAMSKKGKNSLRGFFASTCATIGLANSFKGKRHFTAGLDLLEALVLAGIPPDTETSFERFVSEFLYEECNLVIGRSSADKSGMIARIDASLFEDNESYLAEQMKAAGLITDYSDATRMVSTKGLI